MRRNPGTIREEEKLKQFEAKPLITEIVNHSLKKRLKEAGFKKSGLNWVKEAGEISTVINVQLGRFNMKYESKFTVNLGFYHEQFHKNRGLPMPTKKISLVA